MSLSTILELCEKYMSEGEYLEAAKTLKRAHEGKPPVSATVVREERKIYFFHEAPFLDNGDARESQKFNVIGYAKTFRGINYPQCVKTEVLFKMGTREPSHIDIDHFKKFVSSFIKIQKWLDVKFGNYFGQDKVKSFQEFLLYFKKKEEATWMVLFRGDEDYMDDNDQEEIDETVREMGLDKFCEDIANDLITHINLLIDLGLSELQ
jgi:hypothetical protein